jgi:16S rRNA (guanine966-N2)-methyltransferase
LQVRPTPDRVREALFSILGERCEGADVLDACAGTGALGLEALSRGARSVVLVEKDAAVAAVLRENVKRVGLHGARVVVADVAVALRRLGCEDAVFDIVLVDPPFDACLHVPIAEAVIEARLLARGGLVVMEHPASNELAVTGLRIVDERRYGTVALSFLESAELE